MGFSISVLVAHEIESADAEFESPVLRQPAKEWIPARGENK
jgi:hypothetical protein